MKKCSREEGVIEEAVMEEKHSNVNSQSGILEVVMNEEQLIEKISEDFGIPKDRIKKDYLLAFLDFLGENGAKIHISFGEGRTLKQKEVAKVSKILPKFLPTPQNREKTPQNREKPQDREKRLTFFHRLKRILDDKLATDEELAADEEQAEFLAELRNILEEQITIEEHTTDEEQIVYPLILKVPPEKAYYIKVESVVWTLAGLFLDILITKGAATAALTMVGKVRQCISKLEVEKGELCILRRVELARKRGYLTTGKLPRKKGYVTAEEVYYDMSKSRCMETYLCKFRNKKTCKCMITIGDIIQVLKKLESIGAVSRDGEYWRACL